MHFIDEFADFKIFKGVVGNWGIRNVFQQVVGTDPGHGKLKTVILKLFDEGVRKLGGIDIR